MRWPSPPPASAAPSELLLEYLDATLRVAHEWNLILTLTFASSAL